MFHFDNLPHLANGYDLDGLKIIERQEIEELVGHPNLADRTKLIHGLNIWRKSQVRIIISMMGIIVTHKRCRVYGNLFWSSIHK